jgi:hypothetical protein
VTVTDCTRYASAQRPDLRDEAGAHRHLLRPRLGLGEVGALEQVKAAELLLRLRERPVGDEP